MQLKKQVIELRFRDLGFTSTVILLSKVVCKAATEEMLLDGGGREGKSRKQYPKCKSKIKTAQGIHGVAGGLE